GSVDAGISLYEVLADGTLGPRQHFADVKEPDGMAVDCAGRLFVASHGPGEVLVFSPEGAPVATIPVAPKTTNVAFGGADRRTLLITAGTGVYAMQSTAPGFPY
ncbi:MAG TPA: SMP-30/gluconolactonase/LRE family protein, partial [Polyangiaceae bacterium]|nr:SMP-30/gluconolactonase/LRE family protein [Polyangiaceae bacterium]